MKRSPARRLGSFGRASKDGRIDRGSQSGPRRAPRRVPSANKVASTLNAKNIRKHSASTSRKHFFLPNCQALFTRLLRLLRQATALLSDHQKNSVLGIRYLINFPQDEVFGVLFLTRLRTGVPTEHKRTAVGPPRPFLSGSLPPPLWSIGGVPKVTPIVMYPSQRTVPNGPSLLAGGKKRSS